MYELNSEQISKIKEIIEEYKAFIKTEQGNDELFKWEAMQSFQEHWDIDAKNFSQMLENALKKSDSLLNSRANFPRKMLQEFSDLDQEGLREDFRKLFLEQEPVAQRVNNFRAQAKRYTEEINRRNVGGKKKTDCQNVKEVMWYLTLHDPRTYYPYKYSAYQNMAKLIGFQPVLTEADTIKDLEGNQQLCRLIREQVLDDEELLQIHKQRLPKLWEIDDQFHLLVFDILFFADRYMAPPNITGYWPSLDDYDPEISTEEWKEILLDSNVGQSDSMDMLAMMMQEGGESTCAHLAEKYGNTYSHYNSCGINFAKRVMKKMNRQPCLDGEFSRVFPVAFQGRRVVENTHKRYSWRIRNELQEALKTMDLPIYPEQKPKTAQKFPKNMILYGPPGTGKTYHTVLYAVAIMEGKPLDTIKAEPYEEVRQRYQAYKAENRIAFTTFHQSYGYEDFIEGIRPVIHQENREEGEKDDRKMAYRVEDGIFKAFCNQAKRPPALNQADYAIKDNPKIWKVSLGGTGDNDTRTECMKNHHIRIGWDGYGEDLSKVEDYYQGGERILNTFYHRMSIGDLVFSCYSATQIDAIGVVTGGPEWDDSFPCYKRVRKVKWLVQGIREDIQNINGGYAMVQGSVYELWNVSLENAYQLIEKYGKNQGKPQTQPYVFIIDEINRGNISKIFGELITLLEENKRIGAREETRVRLPYSNKPFGVPQNVYVIGTMNTADRSIMALDTALRRRFSFVEMLPEPETVLQGVTVEEAGCTIEIDKLLLKLNQRIEALYDREHTIGHAYFIPLKDDPDMSVLAEIFTDRVVPLLQEYFFDDYEKIRLVLGDNQKTAGGGTEFIRAEPQIPRDLFGSDDVRQELQIHYTIDKEAAKNPEAYVYLC